MNSVVLLHVGNLFFIGILAGTEFAIHYGMASCFRALDDQCYLRVRQALILRLRILIPAIFVPAALTAILTVVRDGVSPGIVFRYSGLLCLLLWVTLRVVATVPINSATLDWRTGTTPENWRALLDHVERFHVVGTWMAISAFAFFLTAAAQSKSCL